MLISIGVSAVTLFFIKENCSFCLFYDLFLNIRDIEPFHLKKYLTVPMDPFSKDSNSDNYDTNFDAGSMSGEMPKLNLNPNVSFFPP